MVNKNKLLGIMAITTLSLSMLVGCSTPKVEDTDKEAVEEITDNKELTAEDILLTYNEEGMTYLRANYPDNDLMTLALKNIGNEISDIKLKSIDGKEVNLNQFKGKKVIFEIVQDSCSYCKENEPFVEKVLKDYDDVVLVAVFENSSVDGIKDYYKELGIELPNNVWLDENKDLVTEFSLANTPTMVFVDESGKVSLIKEKVYDETTLKDDIEFAFGENKIYEMKLDTSVKE